MIYFVTCNGFETIHSVPAPEAVDVPAECRRLELARNDGFAVFACVDGQSVADAEGWYDSYEGAPPYDAATATGMYDAW